MSNLELGVIGNCSIAVLIDEQARYVWLCLPRFDGDPVFDKLLGGEGTFAVELEGFVGSSQSYDRNTAVLRTVLESSDGSKVEVTDFAPRFQARGRTFRPAAVVRRIRPVAGQPRVRIKLTPRVNWGERAIPSRRGVTHIRFQDDVVGFRATTDAPVSYVMSQTEFVLDREVSFILGPDEPLSEAVDVMARDWEERTADHWRRWARRLGIPLDWQDAVIRAAITLKMCVYEETGGIVAALTSSIPEHIGSARNWDYRFCWLRDAYFTVTALNRLGAMGTLELYLRFLRNVVARTHGGHIQPVYGVGLEADLTEEIVENLPGYRDHPPVRRGNQAAEHIQHDVYGHVVLGAAQAFFDQRLLSPAGDAEFESLERVGDRAFACHDEPDAGIWEYRTRARVHTSSALMTWAACDRLAKVAARLGRADRNALWAERAGVVRTAILENAWNDKLQAFAGAYGGDALDASVLLMAETGFLPGDDPRFVKTVEAIDSQLRQGDHVFRYREADDFGTPKAAFTACTFWHVDALARIGRREEAREMFDHLLARRTKLGLFSEDLDPVTGEQWGNTPQTYSMVGIINSAARLSRPWADVI